ncbi:unnamed protein product [Closterium sp. NIES-53]
MQSLCLTVDRSIQSNVAAAQVSTPVSLSTPSVVATQIEPRIEIPASRQHIRPQVLSLAAEPLERRFAGRLGARVPRVLEILSVADLEPRRSAGALPADRPSACRPPCLTAACNAQQRPLKADVLSGNAKRARGEQQGGSGDVRGTITAGSMAIDSDLCRAVLIDRSPPPLPLQ